jgi:acyl-CoA synthetase (AMP-forming)/AMP-acid ligase II
MAVEGPAAGWPLGTVRALIERQLAARPEAVYAIGTGGGRLSYRQLGECCQAVAERLASLGVQPGDTVSLVMPNGLGTLTLLLGALYGGRCVNPINLLSQPEQMRYVLDHANAPVVLVSPEWEERVRAMAGSLSRPMRVVVADADRPLAATGGASGVPPGATSGATSDGSSGGVTPSAAAAAQPPVASVAPDSLGLLMYTSGTTGKPKGVMLTQANLAASAQAISAEHGLGPQDRVLAVLPLYHINAFAVTMLAPLAHGGSLAMPPRFSAAAFWQQAIDHRCTWINVVPTIISYLLEGAAPPDDALRDIRFCRSASAALPPEHHRAFEHKFGIGIVETMGLTETVAPCFSNPMQPQARRIGSVGRASGCEARVADAVGRTVPDGQTGEILLRGPQVMKGYYKNDEATRDAFHEDGWLRSGDLGHRDSDGFFFVTGRIKELIIKGGENIAPREIDEAILGHPAVLDAASVGVPDRHYGQDIMACIVLREGHGCSEDEMREFCLKVLGRYKTPRIIRFVTELPRGPSGKVQRLKLLELHPLHNHE